MSIVYMPGEVEIWDEFLSKYYRDLILQLASRYPEEKALKIDFMDIERFDPELANALLEHPDRVIPYAEKALRMSDVPGEVLNEVHVRIARLPKRTKIRDLRSVHILKFVALDGLVRKVTEVRPRIVNAAFECRRCEHMILVRQSGSRFREPYECENCGRKGPFKLRVDESAFIDAQKMMIQESPEELRGGEQPQMLEINIEDDLTGLIAPGDRVIVNGVLRSYQKTTPSGKLTSFDVYLDGNLIEMEEQEFKELEITKEDEEEIKKLASDRNIYERIVKSIAPSIYGYEDVKEAIALQLFSGIMKSLPDGARIRGDVHMLLVGDPGTGKSQILRYIAKLAPRAIYTAGKSTTAAGLTATAVKDEFGEGRWTLEAGVLVLADGGIAAIDEMDKMKSDDRSALHEAMEQQMISVAKAGIMATLKSRCALLGAANPKYGRFDTNEPLALQIDMPPTLLSRFDLIFTLTDIPNEDMDTDVAEHILHSHHAGELEAHSKNVGGVSREEVVEWMKPIQPEIPPESLRKYIAYAKRNIFPVMTDEAEKRFIDFYVGLRRQGEDGAVSVTPRQLEALVRLGEASARMKLSNEITMEDANRVVSVAESCLRQIGIDAETGKLDAEWIYGTPKSQRDRIIVLKEIIRELEKEHDGAAPKEGVISMAEERKIGRIKAEEIIEKLKQSGDIFEPPSGGIKLTYK
jgi:replicative DNA helicase Mcm